MIKSAYKTFGEKKTQKKLGVNDRLTDRVTELRTRDVKERKWIKVNDTMMQTNGSVETLPHIPATKKR